MQQGVKVSGEPRTERSSTHLSTASAEDVTAAIHGLQGKDRVGNLGEAVSTAGGVAAGATAAGAIAGAMGATTILGSSTLGGLLGGVLVATTPVGWVVGCALAGGAAVFGLNRMIRSGGRQDEIREEIKGRLFKRLEGLRNDADTKVSIEPLSMTVERALAQGVLDEVQKSRILSLVEGGALPLDTALRRVHSLLAASKRKD